MGASDAVHSARMLLLFCVSVFLSAALLFMVQPLVGKMILPMLGGSPAVWSTCMVFFQTALLAGYGYAHLLTRRLSLKAQVGVHSVVALAALAALPISLPSGWSPPSEDLQLVAWVPVFLAVACGMPFFVVSTTGPLLQSWFSKTTHRLAKDPYFLYAASNAGSVIGLLAYPLVVEPSLRLADQSWVWAGGFAALAASLIACGVAASRNAGVGQAASFNPEPPEVVNAARRVRWTLLAAVPSSLMLGVTQHITTDVASIPLAWVVPLLIYLMTFILAFSPWFRLRASVLGWVLVPLALAQCYLIARGAHTPLVPILALHVVGFAVAAMMCHKALAEDRPRPARLTEYFFFVALGGMLGGVFNGIVAPLTFNSIAEFPIAIALACLLRPQAMGSAHAESGEEESPEAARRAVLLLIFWPVLAASLVLILNTIFHDVGRGTKEPLVIIRTLVTVGLSVVLLWRSGGVAFALALGAATVVGQQVNKTDHGTLLHVERSFFGVAHVYGDTVTYPGDPDPYIFNRVSLRHGTTLHGLQLMSPGENDRAGPAGRPRTYYHTQGPLGDIYRAFQTPDRLWSGTKLDTVAVIGLGTGQAAAYALPGQRYDFYEIDPAIVRIAEDPTLFTYVTMARDDGASVNMIVGDGRLRIAEAPDGLYGLIILDAFSSDSIPVHLLTKEAFELYFRKLRPDGILAVHVSNRYFRLHPIVARISKELGVNIRRYYDPSAAEWRTDLTEVERRRWRREERFASDWLMLVRGMEHAGALATDPNWKTIGLAKEPPLWTDSYSDILSVFAGRVLQD